VHQQPFENIAVPPQMSQRMPQTSPCLRYSVQAEPKKGSLLRCTHAGGYRSSHQHATAFQLFFVTPADEGKSLDISGKQVAPYYVFHLAEPIR